MGVKEALGVFKKAGQAFAEDHALMLAAALAFYTSLSLAPLLVLLIWLASTIGPEARTELIDQVVRLVGPQGGDAIRSVVENASGRPDLGNVAGFVGLATLLFGATAVFVHLQKAMNLIWDIRPRPGSGVVRWLRKRLLSLGMVLSIGLLFLMSLALSAALSFLARSASDALPGSDWIWMALNGLIAFAVFTLLFAAVFRFLPDARIAWKDVWIGAGMTALLFAAGKFAIGLYLGNSSVGSAYGAAGSLIVVLVWVYFSSVILFFGAELTQVYARRYGQRIVPEPHATWQPGYAPPEVGQQALGHGPPG